MTVDSLLGNHEPAPQSFGEKLLQSYSEAVLATDAHNLRRCSGLSSGYAWVRERLGQQRADQLRDRADLVLSALVDVYASELNDVEPSDDGVEALVEVMSYIIGGHCSHRSQVRVARRVRLYASMLDNDVQYPEPAERDAIGVKCHARGRKSGDFC